jgi:hypothetical protein
MTHAILQVLTRSGQHFGLADQTMAPILQPWKEHALS